MSENKQPTPQNEEVDLGQLFKMIGNAFQKLFDFIASIIRHVLEKIFFIFSQLILFSE